MSTVRRVYVEKKPEFAIKAKDLKHEIKHYLNIQTVTNVRDNSKFNKQIGKTKETSQTEGADPVRCRKYQ